MQTSLAKKLFAVGSAIVTAMALMPALASAAVHAAGTNCLSNGTVYFITNDGHKDAYTSAGAFLSYGTNSWSNVVACSAEDLALSSGPFVRPADGKLYLDERDHKTVFLVTNGQIAGFTNPQAFLGLGYSFSKVTPADISFMTAVAPISSSAMAHPAGTLVNQDGTVYLMGPSGKMGIPSPAVFASWGYSFNDVVLANSYDRAVAMSNGVMPTMMPGFLNPLAQGGNTNPNPNPTPSPIPVSGGLSVALAPNTPAASYVAAGSAFNTFTNLNFSAGSSPVIVTNLTVTRQGLGSDSDVNNVYLFDGVNRIGLSTTLGSARATFMNSNGLFTVAANSTKTITIKADLISGLAVGKTYSFGIANASDVVTSGNGSVTGSFPIMGSLMSSTTLSNPSLATLQEQAISVGSTVNAGTNNVLVGQFQFQANNSNVKVNQIILTEVGSINSANDLANVKLMQGSAQLGSTLPRLNADGSAVFDLSMNPLTITSGQNITLSVFADVLGTPNRTFTMTIQRNYDVQATDTTYGAGILPTAIGGSFPIQQSTAISVQAGNLVVTTDPNSPTGNIATSINNVVLASFDVLASGEPVKLFSIPAKITYTGTCTTDTAAGCDDVNFANLRLVDNQGVQLGSTYSTPDSAQSFSHTTGANGGFSFSFGSTNSPLNYVIPANTQRVISIKADILSTFDSALSAFRADLTAGTNNAQGTISLSNTSTTANIGRTLTKVATPFSQSLNGSLSTQTVVKGAAGVRTGSFILTAGAGEGIAVTSVTVQTNAAAATTFQNLHVNINGQPFGITQGSLANTQNYTFSGNPVNIPVGGTAVVDVYEDVQTNASAGTITPVTLINAVGSGANSGTARTSTGNVTGQSLTIAGSGSLTISSDSGTVAASNIAMGATGQTMSTFKLTTGTNEGVNITSIKVTDTYTGTSANAESGIANVKIFDGQTQVGSTIASLTHVDATHATATFQLGNYHIPANTVKTLTVVADVTPYNSTTTSSGTTHAFGIFASGDVVSTGDGSGANITATGTSAGNAQTILRTTLVASVNPASPSGAHTVSTTDDIALFDFKASSNFDAVLNSFTAVLSVPVPATTAINGSIRDANGAITGSTTSCTAVASGTSTCTITLPAGYTVSAGTTRTLDLRIDTATVSFNTSTNQDPASARITAISFNDNGGTAAANMPTNLLPVSAPTLLY